MTANQNHLQTKILVVDDDQKTVDLIQLYLENEDYEVLCAYDGHTALEMAFEEYPDLIILDLMLPHIDGLDICQTLRQETDIPMIMVTARTTEEDKLIGLEIGADDYVTKPFSPRELVARVKAVLRRANGSRETLETQKVGQMVIDYEKHQVIIEGTRVPLTRREFQLLSALASRPGQVFSREHLLDRAFGIDYDGLERTVDVHMMNLRKKIEKDPSQPIYVQTVYGIGYKLVENPSAT